MENPEEVLQTLNDFVKLKPKDIPLQLENYLSYVAKTGDTVYQWSLVKCLFREKLVNVITDFYEGYPMIELPPCPNVDSFNYEIMKNSLLERLESFVNAPFTVQRLCELLTNPKNQYSRADKFMRAVEKNIWVVSTREPGNVKRVDPSQTELVNGVNDGMTVVELGEAVETVTSDGINLNVSSGSVLGLSLVESASGSAIGASERDPTCSRSVDLSDSITATPKSWLIDPSLVDPNRPSVSERVAIIEKSLDVEDDYNRIRFPTQIAEEEDEDFIPNSQDENQYFPIHKKPKLEAASTLEGLDDCNTAPTSPGEESTETSAAVSAISQKTAESLEELDGPLTNTPESNPNLTKQGLGNFLGIDTTSSNIEISSLVPDKLEVTEDLSIATIDSLSSDPTNITSTSDATEVVPPELDIPTIQSIPLTSETDLAGVEESSKVDETNNCVDVLLDTVLEPVLELKTDVLESPQECVQPTILESVPSNSEDPLALIQPLDIESSPCIATAPELQIIPQLTGVVLPTVEDVPESPLEEKLPTEEERDREMMVQNERIESVIQENLEQVSSVLEQTVVPIFFAESLPPVETPMLVAEEGMDVDEDTDEPMDQGDISPKES